MKKLWSIVALVCLVVGAAAQLEVPNPIPNDTVTGTTQNKLVKYNTTSSATSVIITATTDKTGAVGVCADGCGTSGKAAVISLGAASVVTDNATTPNDYVTISSTVAGDGHDFGSSCPTDGSQVIGTIFGAGGTAGTYTVDLRKGLCPPSSAPTPQSALGSSDTLSAAGTFATTLSVPAPAGVGSIIEINANGVYTTTATASPVIALQVNAGGTTALCPQIGNILPSTSQTNAPWNLRCVIQIATTGAPGTAWAWGEDFTSGSAGGNPLWKLMGNGATASFTTTSAQTASIQETATFVTGQTITLQNLTVRNY
jgi:hypothetical protein